MAKIVPGRNGVRTENFRPNVRIFRYKERKAAMAQGRLAEEGEEDI